MHRRPQRYLRCPGAVQGILADQASAAELYVEAWDVRRRAGDDAALRFVFGLGQTDRANGAEMVEAALKLTQIGMSGIAFYDYGSIRPASVDHVKAVLAALDGS